MVLSHITGGRGIQISKNEYFHLLRTLKDRQEKSASAKILNDILVGAPDVLHGGQKAKKPNKVRDQDFKCLCKWKNPTRGAQDASTGTSSGPMSSSSARGYLRGPCVSLSTL